MTTKDVALEEMAQESGQVIPQGWTREGDVVHRANEDAPASLRVSDLRFKGYIRIWDTRTGDESIVPQWLWWQLGQKRRPDGSLVFTKQDPGFRPKQGTIKCLLHPDQPQRAHYDGMGLPVCSKSNLINPLALERHMQRRHRDEWAAIEKERQDAERAEDRAFQRALMERAMGDAQGGRRRAKAEAAPEPSGEEG